MLQILEAILESCQPRITCYYIDVTKSLLKLLVDITLVPIDVEIRQDMIHKVISLCKTMQICQSTSYIKQSLSMLESELLINEPEGKGRLLQETLQMVNGSI